MKRMNVKTRFAKSEKRLTKKMYCVSVYCTLAGAFTNLIFDPVLIIGFNMGADHMERVKETIQHFERFAGSAWRSDGCAGVPPGIYDESGGCGCQDENVNVIDCFQKNARKIYIGIMGDLCHII